MIRAVTAHPLSLRRCEVFIDVNGGVSSSSIGAACATGRSDGAFGTEANRFYKQFAPTALDGTESVGTEPEAVATGSGSVGTEPEAVATKFGRPSTFSYQRRTPSLPLWVPYRWQFAFSQEAQ